MPVTTRDSCTGGASPVGTRDRQHGHEPETARYCAAKRRVVRVIWAGNVFPPRAEAARASVHHRAPVDVPRLTGDVVALLGREEQRQTRDVVGTSDATGGRKSQHRGGRVAFGERALAP